ncbi:MAG: aminoacyl-tRNA hydrolase [Candidatus Pacebacteria bacterium]|nr:aminoacyl-tRNA hydrolase [Candidatus Paceibacterota bacterium]
MFLVVGLGNPGEKYKNTRHNIGFLVADEFQKENNFPDFKFSQKVNAKISEGLKNGEKIIIVKPQTFMNNSGKAVKAIIENSPPASSSAQPMRAGKFSILNSNLAVIHDDIDLPLGKIKIIKGHGAAGHKGVESIVYFLKSKDFIRFRIGIQPKSGKPKRVENFVLQKFTKEEEKILKDTINKVVAALETFLKDGLEKTMTTFNK